MCILMDFLFEIDKHPFQIIENCPIAVISANSN